MYKCQYCDRELKSKAGQLRHESSCDLRDIRTIEEAEDVEDLKNKQARDALETLKKETEEQSRITPYVGGRPKEVTLEVLGGAETYYDGHPRRATKLKGMLSATFDRAERHKIQQLILKVENENAYER